MDIKNLNVSKDFIQKLVDSKKKAVKVGFTLVLAASLLTGCSSEMAMTGTYDMIDTNTNEVALQEGFTQILDVDGEDFKLKVTYACDLEEQKYWTITSDKKLEMDVRTEGLPDGYDVYIDNIHTDTSIIASKVVFNGVLQDSMDDRIHNSQLIGFLISDEINYYGINEIEGQNETFISGTMHAYNGSGYSSVSERRFVESNYLSFGVYGNKISSVIDLLVHTPDMEEGEYKAISVPSDIVIKCNDFVEFYDSSKNEVYYKQYVIDEKGNVTEVKTTELPHVNSKEKTK